MKKLVRIDSASKMIGVSKGTLRNWDRKGLLKPALKSPQRFYSVEDIRAWRAALGLPLEEFENE